MSLVFLAALRVLGICSNTKPYTLWQRDGIEDHRNLEFRSSTLAAAGTDVGSLSSVEAYLNSRRRKAFAPRSRN